MAAPHDSTDDNKTDPAMAETPAAGVPEVNDEEVVLDPIEQLQADLAAALAQVAEQKDQALRAHAEMENVRRRAQEEVSKARKFGIEYDGWGTYFEGEDGEFEDDEDGEE